MQTHIAQFLSVTPTDTGKRHEKPNQSDSSAFDDAMRQAEAESDSSQSIDNTSTERDEPPPEQAKNTGASDASTERSPEPEQKAEEPEGNEADTKLTPKAVAVPPDAVLSEEAEALKLSQSTDRILAETLVGQNGQIRSGALNATPEIQTVPQGATTNADTLGKPLPDQANSSVIAAQNGLLAKELGNIADVDEDLPITVRPNPTAGDDKANAAFKSPTLPHQASTSVNALTLAQQLAATNQDVAGRAADTPSTKLDITWPPATQAVPTQQAKAATAVSIAAAMTASAQQNATQSLNLKAAEARAAELEGQDFAGRSGDNGNPVTSQVQSITQMIATRGDLPVNVARQIAQAMHRSPERAIELTLNPPELGRVRMALSGAETSMMVTITAERQETLDLMRRNIEMLSSAMFELGYEDLQFTFAQGDGDIGGNSDQDVSEDGYAGAREFESDGQLNGQMRLTSIQRMPVGATGVDMRL